jgi:hypothetical protein
MIFSTFILAVISFFSVSLVHAQTIQEQIIANCQAGMCNIFEVTIVVARGDIPRKVRTVAREYVYTTDNDKEPQKQIHYVEVIEKNEDSCTKKVRVPQPIYESVTKLMASLSGDSKDAPPTLTPSQQSMMLFYTTIMQQTLNFDCISELRNNPPNPRGQR